MALTFLPLGQAEGKKDDIIKKKKAGYVVLVLYLPDDTGDRNDNAMEMNEPDFPIKYYIMTIIYIISITVYLL